MRLKRVNWSYLICKIFSIKSFNITLSNKTCILLSPSIINLLFTDNKFKLNFTRDRKLPFKTLIKFILLWKPDQSKTNFITILKRILASFLHQRKKLKHKAFQWLFELFNSNMYKNENNLYNDVIIQDEPLKDENMHFVNW